MRSINSEDFELWISAEEFDILKNFGEVTVQKLFAAGGALHKGDLVVIRGDNKSFDEILKTPRKLRAEVTDFHPNLPQSSLLDQLASVRDGSHGGNYKTSVSLKKV